MDYRKTSYPVLYVGILPDRIVHIIDRHRLGASGNLPYLRIIVALARKGGISIIGTLRDKLLGTGYLSGGDYSIHLEPAWESGGGTRISVQSGDIPASLPGAGDRKLRLLSLSGRKTRRMISPQDLANLIRVKSLESWWLQEDPYIIDAVFPASDVQNVHWGEYRIMVHSNLDSLFYNDTVGTVELT